MDVCHGCVKVQWLHFFISECVEGVKCVSMDKTNEHKQFPDLALLSNETTLLTSIDLYSKQVVEYNILQQ